MDQVLRSEELYNLHLFHWTMETHVPWALHGHISLQANHGHYRHDATNLATLSRKWKQEVVNSLQEKIDGSKKHILKDSPCWWCTLCCQEIHCFFCQRRQIRDENMLRCITQQCFSSFNCLLSSEGLYFLSYNYTMRFISYDSIQTRWFMSYCFQIRTIT